ncbi:ribonuclease T [Thioflexithrix psekupsensis]|nr:ribonuclease T [Thioflexithrix psekupsensis]
MAVGEFMQLMDVVNLPVNQRFRGYLPVVVDVETGGFDAKRDALLEIAAIILELDGQGWWYPGEHVHCHVSPFAGANLNSASLAFTGIDPYHPFRFAVSESEALKAIFNPIREALKRYECNRAILVGHNPTFDLNFVNAASERTKIKRNPFHPFTTFDTATLSGLILGQTVLAKSAQCAGLEWDNAQAHSALYDAQRTAELFCTLVNTWRKQVLQLVF